MKIQTPLYEFTSICFRVLLVVPSMRLDNQIAYKPE